MLIIFVHVVQGLRINLTIHMFILCAFMTCTGASGPCLTLFIIEMITHRNQFVVLCPEYHDVHVLHTLFKLGSHC
jgi:hypothetical protein